jgi:hypothetical protein
MSDTTRRLAGTTYLTVDGLAFAVVGEPGYRLARSVRETMASESGVDGYSEKPQAGYIKAQVRDMQGISIADLGEMTNVTVELQLANGKTITGVGMWQAGDLAVNSSDATCTVQFEGDDVTSDE